MKKRDSLDGNVMADDLPTDEALAHRLMCRSDYGPGLVEDPRWPAIKNREADRQSGIDHVLDCIEEILLKTAQELSAWVEHRRGAANRRCSENCSARRGCRIVVENNNRRKLGQPRADCWAECNSQVLRLRAEIDHWRITKSWYLVPGNFEKTKKRQKEEEEAVKRKALFSVEREPGSDDVE